eukprot:GGOE01020953.1.p1 GENE.GGOE01020953.1~~GGOE01020953.1.p1  ORF type:complete len:546 (-),score=86.99 GGOE01020953.1:131-1768(-)
MGSLWSLCFGGEPNALPSFEVEARRPRYMGTPMGGATPITPQPSPLRPLSPPLLFTVPPQPPLGAPIWHTSAPPTAPIFASRPPSPAPAPMPTPCAVPCYIPAPVEEPRGIYFASEPMEVIVGIPSPFYAALDPFPMSGVMVPPLESHAAAYHLSPFSSFNLSTTTTTIATAPPATAVPFPFGPDVAFSPTVSCTSIEQSSPILYREWVTPPVHIPISPSLTPEWAADPPPQSLTPEWAVDPSGVVNPISLLERQQLEGMSSPVPSSLEEHQSNQGSAVSLLPKLRLVPIPIYDFSPEEPPPPLPSAPPEPEARLTGDRDPCPATPFMPPSPPERDTSPPPPRFPVQSSPPLELSNAPPSFWQALSAPPDLDTPGHDTHYSLLSCVEMTPHSHHSVPSTVHYLYSPSRGSRYTGSFLGTPAWAADGLHAPPTTQSPLDIYAHKSFLSSAAAMEVDADQQGACDIPPTATSSGTVMPSHAVPQSSSSSRLQYHFVPASPPVSNDLARGRMPELPPHIQRMLVSTSSREYNVISIANRPSAIDQREG